MSIGSTIKRLRREQNITQEQLAEYLGITSRAISQWECDRTAPDISQIPALCHIFDVSSDVLLGIDIEKSNEEIQNYLNKAHEKEWAGDFEGETEILREANRKFPRDYKIMERLANSLVCVYSRRDIQNYDEVFDLCNRVLAECTDSITRCKAMRTLGIAYGYAGKEEEELKLAEQMPRSQFSHEAYMVYRWSGNEGLAERQKYMSFLIYQLISMIACLGRHRDDDGKMVCSWEERRALRKFEIDLIETFFPDGDYHFFAQYAEMTCKFFVTGALKTNDYEDLWYWLNKGADYAIHFDTYDFDAPHTSPILRGYVGGGWIMEATGNHSQSMLDWLTTADEVAPLRSDARYDALVERLAKVAKKP